MLILKCYKKGIRRFGADVFAQTFLGDVLAPKHFGTETFWRRSLGAETVWRRNVLALGIFGAIAFFSILIFTWITYEKQLRSCRSPPHI